MTGNQMSLWGLPIGAPSFAETAAGFSPACLTTAQLQQYAEEGERRAGSQRSRTMAQQSIQFKYVSHVRRFPFTCMCPHQSRAWHMQI